MNQAAQSMYSVMMLTSRPAMPAMSFPMFGVESRPALAGEALSNMLNDLKM